MDSESIDTVGIIVVLGGLGDLGKENRHHHRIEQRGNVGGGRFPFVFGSK